MEALLGLVGPKILGYVGGALLAVIGFGLALLKARNSGREAERNQQMRDTLDLVEDRTNVENSVDRMPSDAARQRLRDWGTKV